MLEYLKYWTGSWELLQDMQQALKMLGLNPTEQEVVDIPNNVAR